MSDGTHRGMRRSPQRPRFWDRRAALEFAVSFAQMPDDQAADAVDDVYDFIEALTTAEGSAPPKHGTLPAVRAEAFALLNSVAEPGSTADIVVKVPITVPFLITRPGSRRRPHDKARVMVVRDAMSVRDRFLYRLVHLLETEGVEKIQKCEADLPWQEGVRCGRIFVKKTTKKFCSPTCQQRMYTREYVERGYLPRGKATRKR